MAELNVGDLVFVDEMGINIDLARAYGRAAPGERVVDTKPSARGDNLSVIGAWGISVNLTTRGFHISQKNDKFWIENRAKSALC